MSLDIITANLTAPHGFFARTGGVSKGALASLNAGFGADEPAKHVRANRRRAADALIDGAPIASVHQVHGTDAVLVSDAVRREDRPHADALVTTTPGLILAIVTADCAPVLLEDAQAGVIAAAHAGWRGAFSGVLESTIALMLRSGARIERIAAAIGPCIAQKNYEVDEGFHARFLGEDPANEAFFRDGPAGKPHFDLEAYVGARLAGAGVRGVHFCGLDTYAQPDRFFSYRRATHKGEPGYGRLVSMIGMDAATV